MSALVRYAFDGHDVRIQADDRGGTWFCAVDVCAALGHTNATKAVCDLVDPDDLTSRYLVDAKGRRQKANFVNESGLYALIFGSRLESAKRFKRWVTHEVLPQIRKTGRYEVEVKIAAFIGEEIAKWSQMFPPEYWAQLDRLYQVTRPDPSKRPMFYAGCVQLVYETFDGDIHEEMRRRVPAPAKSGINQHQALSELGSRKMQHHVGRHIGMMDSCSSGPEYKRLVKQVFGAQLRLPLKGIERRGVA